MNEYNPDGWIILKIDQEQGSMYRVFGSWSGGFFTGDSWRMNSGITSIKEEDDYYKLYGYSGSVYNCYKGREGIVGVFNRGQLYEFFQQEGVSEISFDEFREEFCL